MVDTLCSSPLPLVLGAMEGEEGGVGVEGEDGVEGGGMGGGGGGRTVRGRGRQGDRG